MNVNKYTGYKKQLGNKGENTAGLYYKSKGYEVICRNFRFSNIGEIDLIVKKGSLIVFAEVKNRNSSFFGGALYSISDRKKNTLRKVARYFLKSHPEYFLKNAVFRFDLVSIEKGQVELIEDIIR